MICRFAVVASLLLAAYLHAQEPAEPINIDPEEAQQHLLKRVKPKYGDLAELARIQGLVTLQITIDESGSVGDVRVTSGHPMLIKWAMDAAKQWKYEPFDQDGKPVVVKTTIKVSVPDYGKHEEDKHRDPQVRAFWEARRAGEVSLTRNDFEQAAKQLQAARAAVQQLGESRWEDLADVTGELANAQRQRKNFAEAEPLFRESLDQFEKHGHSETASAASVSESLAGLYLAENKADKAEPLLLQAVDIYRRTMPSATTPSAKQLLGRHLAMSSWLLVSIGRFSHRPELVEQHCNDAMDNAKWLDPASLASITEVCHPH
jgi:TonB family protein